MYNRLILPIKNKLNNLTRFQEGLLLVIFSCVYICGVFMIFRIPSCGYHLVDDHEFTAWTYLLEHRDVTLPSLIREYLNANLISGRWRPLYLIMRGIVISVFGTDIRLYYILAMFKTAVLFALIYQLLRVAGADIVRSGLGSMIALTGYQSAAWWKLGTHEIVTAIWFILGMLLMIRFLRTGSKIFAVSSFICYLVMSLYKETFIVLIPFIMLYVVYEDSKTCAASFSILRKRWLYLMVLAVIMLSNIIIIFTCTGSNYIDNSFEEQEEWSSSLISSFTADLKWFVLFGCLMSVVLISHDIEVLKIWKEACLFAAFIIPQFILFARSGISERYIIPFSIGYVLFFCLLAPGNMHIGKIRLCAYNMFLILLLAAHIRAMCIEASYYAYRGRSVTSMLQTVDEYVTQNPDASILSCMYYEGGFLVYSHELLQGYDNTYRLVPDLTEYTFQIKPVRYTHYIRFESSQPAIDPESLNDMDVIIIYNHEDRHWSYEPAELTGFDLSGYSMTKCGTLDVYTR